MRSANAAILRVGPLRRRPMWKDRPTLPGRSWRDRGSGKGIDHRMVRIGPLTTFDVALMASVFSRIAARAGGELRRKVPPPFPESAAAGRSADAGR